MNPPNLPEEGTATSALIMGENNDKIRSGIATSYQSLIRRRLHSVFEDLGSRDASPVAKKTAWFELVENYSRLDLTRESDRLPGQSGLASHVLKHKRYNDSYLAGMWKEDLDQDLFWKVPESHRRHVQKGPPHARRLGHGHLSISLGPHPGSGVKL
jgi:hypothetical protein